MGLGRYVLANLWLQVVISLAAGLGAGAALGAAPVGAGQLDSASEYLRIPANLFLAIIHMIIVPLIFSSIAVAITNLGSRERMRTLGLGVGAYFVTTTTVSILVAVSLASVLAPGGAPDLESLQESHGMSGAEMDVTDGFALDDIPGAVSGIIPKNPVSSYLEGQMFSILVFAVIVGLSMASLPRGSVAPLLGLLESVQRVTLHILLASMRIVPFAVFGLITGVVASAGVGTVAGLGLYMATVLAGLGVMLAVYVAVLRLVAKRPLGATLARFRNPQTLAFSTASSMATMPVTLKAAEDLRVDPRVSRFVIPLGTTINMDGTALYQVVAVFFLAQLFAVELGLLSIMVIVVTSLMASIGTPAVPGAGVVVLSTILVTVGIPPVGILLLLSVDRLLDMVRTMVNVTGDLTASCVFDRLAGAGPEDPEPARA